MKITKESVEKTLSQIKLPDSNEHLLQSGMIKNLQVFGNEIILDIEIKNPALQYRKRIELECLNMIHKEIYEKADVKVNFISKTPDPIETNNTVIKGSPIPGVKNILAISSAKGGVGKSTITANLAVGLADSGYNVGVIDADIYGPSMHIMFDLEESVPEAVERDGKTKIKPLTNYGVKLLSIGFFSDAKQAVVWRGPMASKALNQLIWDADWGELDYLLIDLPPGTGDIHLSLVQSIPVTGAIVISTPQAIAVADAKKGINMFQMQNINVPVLGIIENMSYFTPEELPNNKYYIFGKDGAKNLSDQMNIELLSEIPIVQSLRESSDVGRPAILQGSTPIAVVFSELCKKVVNIVDTRNKERPSTEAVQTTHSKGCST